MIAANHHKPTDKGHPVYAKVEKVSPAKAKRCLKNQDNFRKPNKQKIKNYTRDMRADNWKTSGQVCRFYKDGKEDVLFDGQNKLQAIIDSGTTQTLVMIYDCPDTEYVDMGEKRTLAQHIRHLGMPRHSQFAATTSNIANLMAYQFKLDTRGISIADRIGIFERHKKQLTYWVPRCHDDKRLIWKASIAAVLVLGTQPKGFASCKTEFLEYLSSGEGMEATDPVWLLREMMNNYKRTSAHRINQRHRLALIGKAWNHHREGELINKLSYRDTGPTAEEFPKIR